MSLSKILIRIFQKKFYAIYLHLRFFLSDRCLMAVISEEDDEVNYLALVHLDEYIKKKYANKVVVATTSEFVKENAHRLSEFCSKVFMMTGRQNVSVERCCQFGTANLIRVSLDHPYNNMSHNLVGASGITKEDLICYCCYGLFVYKNVVCYEEFLNERNKTREMGETVRKAAQK